MTKQLNNKWKEFLFAFSGFGPNFLMVLMGAYFTDAINPAALPEGSFQAIGTACYILPAVFPILYALARAFDGIIDIPFAHLTDNLSTRWGRRRPAIAVCFLPMVLSFAMCWWPVGGADGQLLNTIWIVCWALVFFATYTMCLIAFYGSLSTTCCDEPQRLRVSGYKSFFDTISYCMVYALVPLIINTAQIHIDKFVFICLPLMGTMLIPLFLIKEGEKYGYPENDGLSEEKYTIAQSVRVTFKNKVFTRWLAVNCCTYFGLQMFLVAMNAMILGGMGMNGAEMAILNTCAFSPVPVMLWLFNKVKAKKGIRLTYQSCLIAFAIAILSFFFSSNFLLGYDNKPLQYIISCIGSVMGSWAIGAFFMMPYLVTAQISSVEEKLTKKNHSAMYFAGNAVATSIIGAISSALVYENIKMLFIDKATLSVVWAESLADAAIKMGAAEATVFNLGTLLVPFIVAFTCALGAILARKMPRDYTPDLVAKEFKKMDPSLDIDAYLANEENQPKQEKGEIVFVQVGLSVLSGFIFGFIWSAFMLRDFKRELSFKKPALVWLLCCFVPFASAFYVARMFDTLKAYGQQYDQTFLSGKGHKLFRTALIVLAVIFPILPLNVVALGLMQFKLNELYKLKAEA
ncbi:MAG: MFS transporter [Clostridia bacterium]|nr:MFS transporter [Clostridia bacterium]